MNDRTEGPVRGLTLADLEDCYRLAEDRDWPREEHKWRFLFEVGEPFGIDAPDGDGLAGTAILTRYPPPDDTDSTDGADGTGASAGLAAVSMVLAASRYARRGIGTRLVRHALERAGTAVTTLYATEAGRPVYERLGFEAVEGSTMYLGPFTAPAGSSDGWVSRPATPDDLPEIAALDARAVGADRSAVLAALPRPFHRTRVVERDGRLAAYAGAWTAGDLLIVGPVVAVEPSIAEGLIVDLCRDHPGSVRLDLRHGSPLHDWARARGLPARGETTIMVHGPGLPGRPDLRIAPILQALG